MDIDANGYSTQLTRDKTFAYNVKLKVAQTEGFADPAKPVEDNITYSYSAVKADGGSVPYPNVLTVNDGNSFSIASDAPLGATATIAINISHNRKDGTTVNDIDTIYVPITVASRTFTVKVVLNGGTLTDANKVNHESFERVEDSLIFEGLTVQKTGYLFEGWYLDSALTELYSLDGKEVTMPSENLTLYAKWKAHSFTLKFNANGGTVSETSRLVLCDTAVGTLPTPTRTGYTFGGWFTSDGKQITASSSMATATDITVTAKWTVNSYKVSWNDGDGYSIVVKRTSSPNAGAATGTLSNNATVYYGDVLSVAYTKDDYWSITGQGATSITVTGNVTSSTIYATATLTPVSGWVKASEMPSGAQVINRKWSYTLREYTSNSASSPSGWTKYDTVRTGWGATVGPVYSDPSNGARNVWSEQYVTSSNYKTVYVYYRYAANRDGGYGAPGQTSSYPNYYEYEVDSPLEKTTNTTFGGTSWTRWKYWYSSSNWVGVYGEKTKQVWISDNYGTRWYYQDPVYTYYYYRDLAKEATSNPTGQSNVSNVVEWVQYRAK